MDERKLLELAGGPVTHGRLVRELRALGLGEGDVVMFHTRLSALGFVPGGPRTVIAALAETVGGRGTLMAPAGWNDAPPYDLADWPEEWREAARDGWPPYDPALSEADHNNGRLPEALRHESGAVRGRHPDASFVALGAAAAELMADQPWDHPHGPDSPLARLVAAGGRVLLLGAPLDTLTLLHHAEALAEAPGKRYVDYEQPVLVGGERVWRRFRDIDTEDGAFDYTPVVPAGEWPFTVIAREMLAAGIGVRGTVGAAECHLFEARDVVRSGVRWIEAKLGGGAC
ncbi:aminoglycoside 3-N-acetyltransferase [Streptomyces sp. AV19]|uniref:aminoglycoside 3-N-acetyltransferase n=1 Tax=Streptomyces sp. AV19 TaxID=2793068 RepID=UPI0018FF0F15|nr:aminoglycoside 3-N-acetyltransferase [Streptomyces sp. AV19]MBH1934637.1 aminoglycoside 3-N-acetyltransferase [Streptomyces sp. AV19]MDG4530827.1 aminoglycoside 3-N-acetyltransferase [Streptomyces sp. AV19]